ncbi:MAG: phosphoribosylaminoimidazolesuccinocarboxamide synthase [Gammaproteobacteria bacterium]|nr:phosphoribosylaminoimidazolesuccinocarboxamide synthase [Gammaproteobacteria bacterium]
MGALFESHVRLPLVHRGKVRDLYAVDGDRLLMVATDRLSAFDVVLPDPIPGKGRVLTALSRFWFARTRSIVGNHLADGAPEDVVAPGERDQVRGRSLLVRRVRPLPVEAIVRGYLAGSAWKEYQTTGTVSGTPLPPGLAEAARLPAPVFTPSTKAPVGEHDRPLQSGEVEDLLGAERAAEVRRVSLRLYEEAAAHALGRGILIADTKFEFGVDADGTLVLIDEVLTPDSSRFWPQATYRPGTNPESYDKQYVRDYLESIGWNKKAPGPRLPDEVVARTAAKYAEALAVLTR